jgi:hypothetical protein
MNKNQAYTILEQVCAQFRGTPQEHQIIQQALALLKPVAEKKDESNEQPNN